MKPTIYSEKKDGVRRPSFFIFVFLAASWVQPVPVFADSNGAPVDRNDLEVLLKDWLAPPSVRRETHIGVFESRYLERRVFLKKGSFRVAHIVAINAPKTAIDKKVGIRPDEIAQTLHRQFGMKTPWRKRKTGVALVFDAYIAEKLRYVTLYFVERESSYHYSISWTRSLYAQPAALESELIQRRLAGVAGRQLKWPERFALQIKDWMSLPVAYAADCGGLCSSLDPGCIALQLSCATNGLSDSLRSVGEIRNAINMQGNQLSGAGNAIAQELSNANSTAQALGKDARAAFDEGRDDANRWAQVYLELGKQGVATADHGVAEVKRLADFFENSVKPGNVFATAAVAAAGASAVSVGVDLLLGFGRSLYELMNTPDDKDDPKLDERLRIARENHEKMTAVISDYERLIHEQMLELLKNVESSRYTHQTAAYYLQATEARIHAVSGHLDELDHAPRTAESDACRLELEEDRNKLARLHAEITRVSQRMHATQMTTCGTLKAAFEKLGDAEVMLYRAGALMLRASNRWLEVDKRQSLETSENLAAFSQNRLEVAARVELDAREIAEKRIEELRSRPKLLLKECIDKRPGYMQIPVLSLVWASENAKIIKACTEQFDSPEDRAFTARKILGEKLAVQQAIEARKELEDPQFDQRERLFADTPSELSARRNTMLYFQRTIAREISCAADSTRCQPSDISAKLRQLKGTKGELDRICYPELSPAQVTPPRGNQAPPKRKYPGQTQDLPTWTNLKESDGREVLMEDNSHQLLNPLPSANPRRIDEQK